MSVHVTRLQAAAASTLHNMALLFKNTGRLQESAQASATPNSLPKPLIYFATKCSVFDACVTRAADTATASACDGCTSAHAKLFRFAFYKMFCLAFYGVAGA